MIRKEITLPGFVNSMGSSFPLRKFILVVSILISVAVYNILINKIAPTENVLSLFTHNKPLYKFYSGSKGGFYIKIGSSVETHFKKNQSYQIVNEETDGGLDNVIKVVADPNSFGLVQESTLSSGDMLRNHVRFVSPLYMERLHIVYRISAAEESGLTPENIVLTKDNTKLQEFFKSSDVSIGPVGSGTRTASTYLLDIAGLNPKKTHALSQEEGLQSIKAVDGIDILMNIVGAPNESINELLKSEKFALLSVDPTIISEINKSFKTNYRQTDFKNKYSTSRSTGTLGSYAYLIANKNVSETTIHKVLGSLHTVRPAIKRSFKNIVFDDQTTFQLDEIDFSSNLQKDIIRKKLKRLRALLIFCISVLVNATLTMVFLVWVFSSVKLAKYYKLITKIYKSSFPKSTTIDYVSYSIPYIKTSKNRTRRLGILVLGITDTFDILTEVRKDYDTGGITDSHFENLKLNLKQSLQDFRKAIFRNLYIQLNTKSHDIDRILLDSYLTESFLNFEDYQELIKHIEK